MARSSITARFLPGDGVRRAEVGCLGGDGAVGVGGLHGAVIPGIRVLVVRIAALVRSHHLPVKKAAQYHGEGCPGHGMAQAEAGGGLSLEQPQIHRPGDLGGCPVAGGNIGKAPGCGGGGRQQAAQQRGQHHKGQNPLYVFAHAWSGSFSSSCDWFMPRHCTKNRTTRQTQWVEWGRKGGKARAFLRFFLYVRDAACYNS